MSNFALYPITLQGKTWPTSEHYFQAQKFEGTDDEDRIREALTPKMAALIARDRNKPLRQDWETVKKDIMREAVGAKFEQHADIRDQLLGTGNATLVEHTATASNVNTIIRIGREGITDRRYTLHRHPQLGTYKACFLGEFAEVSWPRT